MEIFTSLETSEISEGRGVASTARFPHGLHFCLLLRALWVLSYVHLSDTQTLSPVPLPVKQPGMSQAIALAGLLQAPCGPTRKFPPGSHVQTATASPLTFRYKSPFGQPPFPL